MCLKAAAICLLAVVLSGLVQKGNTACKELQPVDGFQNDFVSGKFYWIYQKIAYDDQKNSKCIMTYTFVDGNIWTFIDMYQNSDSEQFIKMVGVMDTPGHWNISSVHPNGTSLIYSLTAIAGKSKKYVLLYSCNHDSEEYSLYYLYYKRVGAGQIDQDTFKGVFESLGKNNLTTAGGNLVDNTHCICK